MEALLPQLVPYLLLVFRLGGMFLVAPLVASAVIPARVRVLLIMALSAAVFPTLPPAALAGGGAELDVVTLGAAVVGEVALGFVIGLLMLLPVVAVQTGAVVMGQQMGFGLASVYNPALESESDVLGELLVYLALGAYVLMGGVEAAVLAVLRTLEHVPLGAAWGSVALGPAGGAGGAGDMVVGVMGGGLELALRISAPVLAIVFFETVASALVMKTMPAINILSVGFALKIGLGLLALVGGLAATEVAIADHVAQVSRAVLRWTAGLGA